MQKTYKLVNNKQDDGMTVIKEDSFHKDLGNSSNFLDDSSQTLQVSNHVQC